MRMGTKRFIACLLSFCMVTQPLTACSTANNSSEMEKGVAEDVAQGASDSVPFNVEGTYKVSFKESDLKEVSKEQPEAQSEAQGEQITVETDAEEQMSSAPEQEIVVASAGDTSAEDELDELAQVDTQDSVDAEEIVLDEGTDGQITDSLVLEEPADEQATEDVVVEEPAQEEAVEVAEDGETTTGLKFADIKAEDVTVKYSRITNADEVKDDATGITQPTYGEGDAKVTSVAVSGDTATVEFTDEEALDNKTAFYVVYIAAMGKCYPVAVEFEDHTLQSVTEYVLSDSESNEVELKLAEGAFASDVSVDDVTVSGSFKDMTVEGVEASGDTLKVRLSGAPSIDYEVSTTFTSGEVTVQQRGIVNGYEAQTAYVEVRTPDVTVSTTEVEVNGDTVTLPLDSAAFEAGSVTADQVSIEGAEVTGVEQGEDGQVLVTAKVTDVEDGEDAATALSGAQITVGDTTGYANVASACFYPVFEGVVRDGDNVKFNITLLAQVGTFADGISADAVSVTEGFEGGSVDSLTRKDEYTCDLVVSVPASDTFNEENYNFVGTIELAEGALVQDWGDPAPVCEFTRDYDMLSLGREDDDDDYDDVLVQEHDDDTEEQILILGRNGAKDKYVDNGPQVTYGDAHKALPTVTDYEINHWVGRMGNDEKANFRSALSTVKELSTNRSEGAAALTAEEQAELDKANAYLSKVKAEEERKDKIEKEQKAFDEKLAKNLNAAMGAYTEFVMLLDLDPTVTKIVQVEGEMLGICTNILTGNYGFLLQNALNIAKICGAFKKTATAPSISDVMSELHEIRGVLSKMDTTLKQIDQSTKDKAISDVKTDLGSMQSYTTSLRAMFQKAVKGYLLESGTSIEDFDGMINENSSNAEKNAYNEKLAEYHNGVYQYMKTRADADDSEFRNMKSFTDKLEQDFRRVAVRFSDGGTSNPIYQFDARIAYNYNWQTDGYYERAMYRADVTDTLTQAYMMLDIFERLYENETEAAEYARLLKDATDEISRRSAGPTADSVRRGNLVKDEAGVYQFPSEGLAENVETIEVSKGGQYYWFSGGPEGTYIMFADNNGYTDPKSRERKSTKELIDSVELDADATKDLSDSQKLKMKFDTYLTSDGAQIIGFTGAGVYSNVLKRTVRSRWVSTDGFYVKNNPSIFNRYNNIKAFSDEELKEYSSLCHSGGFESISKAGVVPSAFKPDDKTQGIVTKVSTETYVTDAFIFDWFGEDQTRYMGEVLLWDGHMNKNDILYDTHQTGLYKTPITF